MDKVRVTKKFIALVLAGYILFAPVKANSSKKYYKPGTFIEINMEDEESKFNQYIVAANDNLSIISRKICKYFGEKQSSEYWPVLACLNGYPKVIHKGEVILFPKTFEKLVQMRDNLEEIGWTTSYKIANDVYGKRKKHKVSVNQVGQLLASMYIGKDICIDEDFINLFLEYKGLDDNYTLIYDDVYDEDVLYAFTESIPNLDDLLDYQRNKKQKVKVLK